MSQELADLQPSEQTQATVTDNGAVEKAVPQTTETPDKFPEFKETSEKSVLRQQIEHAAKRGNPYKAADGKFTKKPLETKAPETAATEAKPESEAKTEAKVEQAPALPMPKSWPKEKQAIWDALPTEAKEWWGPHAAQTDQNFEKYKGQLKTFEDVIAPYQPLLAVSGRSAPEAIQQALSWHAALSNEATRGQAFQALLQAYPHQLGSPAAIDPAQQPYVVNDPRVDQVQQELAALKAQREAEISERTSKEVSSWAKDKPHFEKVKFDMGLLIKAAAEAGREMSLDEAYHKSTWATPDIAEQLKKAEFEAQSKANRDAAEKAKLAAVSVQTRSPAPPALNGAQGGKLRDTIREAMATVNGAGRA